MQHSRACALQWSGPRTIADQHDGAHLVLPAVQSVQGGMDSPYRPPTYPGAVPPWARPRLAAKRGAQHRRFGEGHQGPATLPTFPDPAEPCVKHMDLPTSMQRGHGSFLALPRHAGIAPRDVSVATTSKRCPHMSAVSALKPEMLSIREFARRDGCDESLVRRGIKTGHLKRLADGKLDAALVGTGWCETNRRNVGRADSADLLRADPATRADPPHQVSAPWTGPAQDTLLLVPMMVGPSGMHPLAIDLAAMVAGTALDAALILLRHLPLETVRQVVDEMETCSIRAAVELLDDDDIAPPSGMASWAEHPIFVGPHVSEGDWHGAAAEAASNARAGKAAPDA